jgi:hypothetical protein
VDEVVRRNICRCLSTHPSTVLILSVATAHACKNTEREAGALHCELKKKKKKERRSARYTSQQQGINIKKKRSVSSVVCSTLRREGPVP